LYYYNHNKKLNFKSLTKSNVIDRLLFSIEYSIMTSNTKIPYIRRAESTLADWILTGKGPVPNQLFEFAMAIQVATVQSQLKKRKIWSPCPPQAWFGSNLSPQAWFGSNLSPQAWFGSNLSPQAWFGSNQYPTDYSEPVSPPPGFHEPNRTSPELYQEEFPSLSFAKVASQKTSSVSKSDNVSHLVVDSNKEKTPKLRKRAKEVNPSIKGKPKSFVPRINCRYGDKCNRHPLGICTFSHANDNLGIIGKKSTTAVQKTIKTAHVKINQ
jgi:hypothetical protein